VALRTGEPTFASAHYAEARAIRARFAAEEAEPGAWARDLAVSDTKLGDVALAAGDTAGARRHFEASLAARMELARRAPGDITLKRDLGICLERIGMAAHSSGDAVGARAAWEQELKIAEGLRAAAPADPRARRFQAVVHALLATLGEADHLDHRQKAIAIFEDLASENRLTPRDAPLLARLRGEI
jgi:hypothetical protein